MRFVRQSCVHMFSPFTYGMSQSQDITRTPWHFHGHANQINNLDNQCTSEQSRKSRVIRKTVCLGPRNMQDAAAYACTPGFMAFMSVLHLTFNVSLIIIYNIIYIHINIVIILQHLLCMINYVINMPWALIIYC